VEAVLRHSHHSNPSVATIRTAQRWFSSLIKIRPRYYSLAVFANSEDSLTKASSLAGGTGCKAYRSHNRTRVPVRSEHTPRKTRSLLKARSMETSYLPHYSSARMHQVWEDRRPTPPLPEPRLPDTTTSRSEEASLEWRTKALEAAQRDVFTTLTRSDDRYRPKTATLNIAATQRLVIAHQQRDISAQAAKLYAHHDGETLDAIVDRLRGQIHDYCM
jgi:hypothetical protein